MTILLSLLGALRSVTSILAVAASPHPNRDAPKAMSRRTAGARTDGSASGSRLRYLMAAVHAIRAASDIASSSLSSWRMDLRIELPDCPQQLN